MATINIRVWAQYLDHAESWIHESYEAGPRNLRKASSSAAKMHDQMQYRTGSYRVWLEYMGQEIMTPDLSSMKTCRDELHDCERFAAGAHA